MRNRDRLATVVPTDPADEGALVRALERVLGQLAARNPDGYLVIKAAVHGGEVTRLDLHSRTEIAPGRYLFTTRNVSGYPDYVCFDD
jgi:hypothetical protein